MLAGGRADERVVDGAARDAQPGELGTERGRGLVGEERRRREVVGEQGGDVGRRPASSAGQARQNRVGLEPGVTREAQATAADGLESRRVCLVVLDDEGDRRARVEQQDLVRLSVHAGRRRSALARPQRSVAFRRPG